MPVPHPHKSSVGDPPWEIALLFPAQGAWSEHDYLAIHTNRLVELSDGKLEVLPMPSEWHQMIVAFLFDALRSHLRHGNQGTALFAPLRVRLWEGKYREPDIVFMLAENGQRRGDKYWKGADLVVEVVSEDDPDRDLVEKRSEYERAGISEYWIVDPRDGTITVLALDPSLQTYESRGVFQAGESAHSSLLQGFAVEVADVFARQ